MSKPAIVPEITAAGIAVDPRTLERVIPESRRPDGSVRKQLKIRPGYTPQEDVRRFRGSRQQQMDATALPKGHVVGWAPAPTTVPVSKASMSKAQKKNEKRKEKRKEKRDEDPKVKDNWDDEDEDEGETAVGTAAVSAQTDKAKGAHTPEKPNWAAAPSTDEGAKDAGADGLADKLGKLEVR
ncbi:hypothetical protein C2E23DRAFT_820498 [Lenzites betulinus]|nr:hypothetical protein C2E23DRAFT_820498 [Lenzites betulinus]